MLTAEEFWQIFCEHNLDLSLDDTDYSVWQFMNGEKGCNRLTALVRAKIKTATSSPKFTFEMDEVKIPEVGDYSVILDTDNEPQFILKDIAVTVKKFSEVDEDFAFKEGEGDQSLDYWKKSHKEYFTHLCEEYGTEFSEDMEIVCEEFEIVFQ